MNDFIKEEIKMPGELNACEAINDKLTKRSEDAAIPSPVLMVKVESKLASYTVKVPKNELFRVKAIFQDNEYSILGTISSGDKITCVDIGANIGLYSIYVMMHMPNSTIHCFEPSPASYTLLHENVSIIPSIRLHTYGLFKGNREAMMNIHQMNTGENSIKFNNHNYINSVPVQLRDAGTEFDRLRLEHIDILKIDTEGCEVEILESLGYRLSQIDYILIEYHSEKERREIDNILKGFHIFSSKAGILGLGTVKYVNARLVKP